MWTTRAATSACATSSRPTSERPGAQLPHRCCAARAARRNRPPLPACAAPHTAPHRTAPHRTTPHHTAPAPAPARYEGIEAVEIKGSSLIPKDTIRQICNECAPADPYRVDIGLMDKVRERVEKW